MHDGGVGVAAFVNGKMVCNSEATYGLEGGKAVVDGKEWKTISKMSECLEPFEMKKGDKVTLEASYDNIAHPLSVFPSPRILRDLLMVQQPRFAWRGARQHGLHDLYFCSQIVACIKSAIQIENWVMDSQHFQHSLFCYCASKAMIAYIH